MKEKIIKLSQKIKNCKVEQSKMNLEMKIFAKKKELYNIFPKINFKRYFLA